jgi:hypothetical protein
MNSDIFAYAVTAGETHGEEIHRWSGHSWFKQWWFDLVAIEQGVDKPRAAPMVTNAELDRFETAIVNGEVLNYSFDDWKDHDLAFVAKARAALAAGKTVVLEHPVFTGTIYNPFDRKIVWRRVNQTWQLMLGSQCVAHIERSPNEGWPERYWMTVTNGDHEDYGYYGLHFSKLNTPKRSLSAGATPFSISAIPRRTRLFGRKRARTVSRFPRECPTADAYGVARKRDPIRFSSSQGDFNGFKPPHLSGWWNVR